LNVKVKPFLKPIRHDIIKSMKVIIIGAGMIGLHIARELIEERRDVVIVEKDAEAPGVHTKARIENPFYSSLSEPQRRAFGLHVIINPVAETAEAVGRIVDEGLAAFRSVDPFIGIGFGSLALSASFIKLGHTARCISISS